MSFEIRVVRMLSSHLLGRPGRRTALGEVRAESGMGPYFVVFLCNAVMERSFLCPARGGWSAGHHLAPRITVVNVTTDGSRLMA